MGAPLVLDDRLVLDRIAIVGVACRFPGGVGDLDGLWSVLSEGREVVGAPPPDRFDVERFWDANQIRPGKSYTFAGGYLDDVAGFDADFFGISPREALSIDPQQRLLLELGFEALDDAGIAPGSLAGTDAAVFVGVSAPDYAGQHLAAPQTIGPYTNSGAALSNTANRLSYHLDVHGPSLKVDTACASSLNAVHLACEHLRHGGGRVAFVAGVNLLLNPLTYVGFAKAGFLSPTGRCRPFSAAADGYVRAEGGGVLVLKRLADALADGDRVQAVIAGSGTNSDGHTTGLVLPSGEAQEALLRQVYERFALDPDDLAYLEAHGTGTPIGDPVECRSIGNALGTHRSGAPLPVGSVKANLGHLEPASGMAGLCKAILVLRHGVIPPTPNASPRSTAIDFDGLALTPVEQQRPVAGRLVGVNSFGFGGANVHVVLDEPPTARPPARTPAAVPVVVSAHTEVALAEAVSRMDERLAGCPDFADLAYTSFQRRGKHAYRRAVLAATADEARHRLAEQVAPRQGTERGRVAFVFSGHGAQWPGMAAELLDTDPVFTRTVAEIDAALEPRVGWTVTGELRAADSRMHDTRVVQPALFAVQAGIAATLAERGLRPEAVYGHSVGEIAAAFVAGVYDVDQAVELVVARSQAQARTAGTGRMAAVNLGAADMERLLGRYDGRVEVAGINSANDVTVAGPAEDLRDLADRLAQREVFCRLLDLDYPFHSAAMDPLRPSLLDALTDLAPKPATVEFVSTVTGAPLAGEELDAGYWWRNVREPVRFADATGHLIGSGFDTFVEIGPKPVLQTYLKRAAGDTVLAVLPTLTRSDSGPKAVRAAVESALAVGVPIAPERYFSRPGRVVRLPAYPWQRARFWLGGSHTWAGVTAPADHVLLGDRAAVSDPTWQSTVDPARLPWLTGHRVAGTPIMPAAGYLEMGWAAGQLALDGPAEVRELQIPKPMVAPDDESALPRMQVSLSEEDGLFRVATRAAEGRLWQTHARGRVRRRVAAAPPALDLVALRTRFAERGEYVEAETHYADGERLGLVYGPEFLVVSRLWVDGMEVLADYDCGHLDLTGFHAHPAWTDTAPQLAIQLGRILHGHVAHEDSYLPVAIGTARLWGTPARTGAVYFRCRTVSDTWASADITMTDGTGAVLLELLDFRFLRIGNPARPPVRRQHTELRAAPRGRAPAAEVACRPPRIAAPPDPGHDERRRRQLVATAAFTVRAFATLLGGEEVFFTDDLLAAGVRPEFTRLLDLLTGLAAEHGYLEWRGEFQGRTRWRLRAAEEPSVAGLVADFPEYVTGLTLFGRCGLHLAELLRGERNPLDILFPAHGSDTLTHYYDLFPVLRPHNEAAAEAMRALVGAWPADRLLRILEVGGGTGGLTAALLPVLPPERTRYVFTDVSQFFLAPAQVRFAGYDFVEYRTLDMDEPDAEPGTFDVMVAGNALHAAKDVRAALRGLAELLTDHGRLLFVEAHDPALLALPFGLAPGFWSMTDLGLRPASPLLSARQWRDLVSGNGFRDPRTVLEAGLCSVATATRIPRPTPPADPSPTAAGRRVLVVAEDGTESERAAELATRLAQLGADVVRMSADIDPAGWLTAPGTDVVLLLGETGVDPAAAVDATIRRFELVRALAISSADLPSGTNARLWLVSGPAGVNPAPERATDPVGATLWGATRAVACEHSVLGIRRVSVERDVHVDRLAREVLDPTAEDEVVLTASGRFVPRLRDLPPAPAGDSPYRLTVRDPGPAYRLAWVAMDVPEPGPGEVVVEVHAAGVNYRDALISVGMLPGWVVEAGVGGMRLGGELAGLVTAVGPGVTRFRPGDRVFGSAPAAFASHAVTNENLVALVPDGIDLASAATMPVAFVSAHYGLRHLAQLAEGEVVLVHGAAGGVGLAAVQCARAAGATVIATAGTEEKRDFLRLLGIEHVFDSRGPGFAAGVLAATGGRGVDVVLNSLGGELIGRSLELLRLGGRFVELGKRDLYGDRNVSLYPFRDNISYFVVDIDQLAAHRVEQLSAAYDTIQKLIRTGNHRPIPYRAFPATRIAEALRSIQHSRHIGKLVVTFDRRPPVERAAGPRFTPDPEGTYLVTGGAGGFGAETARWLADRGARHLSLVNRRGAAVPGAEEVVTELTARGVTVSVHAADVTDEAAMRAVVAAIDGGGAPLRGVVHAAMVLDDASIADLTPEKFRAVLAPKLAGALVLDRITGGHELDLFLMFSSAAAVVGNAGQAAYCAGNLYLEALARARRARGLAGQAIAWGALAEAGYMARNETAAGTIVRAGLTLMPLRQVRAALDDLVGGPEVSVVWSHDGDFLRRLYPHVTTPRLGELTGGEHIEHDEHDDLLDRLRQAGAEEAIALTADSIVATLAEVLGVAPERIDRNRPLDQIGVDSLMGAELITKMRRRLGREIPVMRVIASGGIDDLARSLVTYFKTEEAR
ncbi:MAG TPA: SDR family NAD(P)-dependent oxidoreductase [Actinophytocola sp.]|jgi:acyl transferase domain-containing protein/NADPH:quinone reductase-like Zn-dependent oxidoreductase/SAM-dependent methyltransferase/acyl carrier protein|uniref:SDR family NAD(P)-dependent oxidoreductase n=1 Tax=Actinophytocola sp. TaxID=1872138 RepID=UPI002E076000|nr:SDR family NAD(P)-dependent oxidoreductase [Actinophytocola sp.]